MGRAACTRDDDFQTTAGGHLGIFVKALGGAVSADHARLVGNAELGQHVRRVTHGFPVGLAAHDNADEGILAFTHKVGVSRNGDGRPREIFWEMVGRGLRTRLAPFLFCRIQLGGSGGPALPFFQLRPLTIVPSVLVLVVQSHVTLYHRASRGSAADRADRLCREKRPS